MKIPVRSFSAVPMAGTDGHYIELCIEQESWMVRGLLIRLVASATHEDLTEILNQLEQIQKEQ